VSELLTPAVPRLVLQGGNDSFGTADQIRAVVGDTPGITIVELPGADHSFRIGKSSAFTPAELRMALVTEVSRFIAAVVGITTP
jgi:predicted alpha/beta-hydrolase family hydrolase